MPVNNPPPAELTDDQKKALAAAEKITVALNDPKTEQFARARGIPFFAKGTVNYSTGDFFKKYYGSILAAAPALIASGGADLNAWIQLIIGTFAAYSSAIKALSKLVKNDAVYEQLYQDYPIFCYTCNNDRLDFQNLLVNCATARQRAENVLIAQENDPLFYQKLCTWLYFKFGLRPTGDLYSDIVFFWPDVVGGKVNEVTANFVYSDSKDVKNAQFLGVSGRYQGQFNLPFNIASDSCNSEQIMHEAQFFMYLYVNNLLDENFNYAALFFNNAGFPNPETLKDETRSNNYFFESFRQAGINANLKKKQEEQEQTTTMYYIIAVVVILLLIYYYSKK